MIRALLSFTCCAATLGAQIPHDHLIYAHRLPSATIAALGVLDPSTGVATPIVPVSGALTTSGSRTVAIDPQNPSTLYASSSLSISIAAQVIAMQLDGNLFTPSNLSVPGVAALPFRLRFAPGFGLLLLGRGGPANRMWRRDMATGTITAQPSPSLLPANASDLAFWNGRAFATSEGDGSATAVGTIVVWDLAANTDAVLGNAYPPLSALAVFGGQLLAGDVNGNLWFVDPMTGAMSPFLATGLGKIVSIAVTSTLRVFVLVESGASWTIHDAFAPAPPLYQTTNQLEDLEVGPAPVPTMLLFGTGCRGSNTRVPVLRHTSMPALGGTLGLQLDDALGNAPAFLVLGSSRTADALGPLPRDLAILGMPGCQQYVDLLVSLFTPTMASGSATISLAVPNQPGLLGLRLPLQWLALDAAANRFGATTSNGGEAYVR